MRWQRICGVEATAIPRKLHRSYYYGYRACVLYAPLVGPIWGFIMQRVARANNGLKAKIISGSAVMLSGSTLGIAINLAYNVAVAHFLGPKGFGNANALYTLLTILSAITLSFQIVTSKIIAQRQDEAGRDTAFYQLERAAWVTGLLTATVLILFRAQIASFLDLPSSSLVIALAAGGAFYIPLGARRGYIQGAFGFRKLATNLVLEGAARLIGSVAMVYLGFDVMGVIVANAVALAIAYFAITPRLQRDGGASLPRRHTFREMSHATVFFAGQVLINNADIVLVKHYFSPADAGLYAAIAMVGRVTFACSTAIVNSMFPVIAGSKREERKDPWLIGTTLLLVLGVGLIISIALRVLPSALWTILFGSSFQIAGPHGFPYLLSLYALATIIYCLSVVVMSYEMSFKIANTTWYQLLFSGVLIAGLARYHASLQQVILVQLFLLLAFLALIGIPFAYGLLRAEESDNHSVRLLHSLREDDVIAEFLQSDFGHQAYRKYHDRLRSLVFQPDLNNYAQCALRRSLFQVRHRALWSELPSDTQWFQAEISAEDLRNIRVFPRAHWTRIARGNFGIGRVAERIAANQGSRHAFHTKIAELREAVAEQPLDTGSVILIGLNESSPLTIIDGNHRLVAAVLEGKLENLRFICGFSPSMSQCCWYRTSVPNLMRYGVNLLRHRLRQREATLVLMR